MKGLPNEITDLLNHFKSPDTLIRHLTLVYNVTIEIIAELQKTWPTLMLSKQEILFGAATHDIGKAVEIRELYEKGNKHTSTGYKLLIDYGIDENLARFTKTHCMWNDDDLELEDLVVAMADKIWKGKRIDDLEERLIKKIALKLNLDYWEVYIKTDRIISNISNDADRRLMIQN